MLQQCERADPRASGTAAGSTARWALVLQHRERALRVARSRCARRVDAEDCAQEALLRVALMPEVDERSAGALISTVVANLAIDGYRREARGMRYEEQLGRELVAQVAEPADERACDADEARWVSRQVLDLRPVEQQALLLRAQEHSVIEIARALNISYKAAESALGRARLAVRTAWRATLGLFAYVAVRSKAALRLAGTGVAAALIVAVPLLSQSAPSSRAPLEPPIAGNQVAAPATSRPLASPDDRPPTPSAGATKAPATSATGGASTPARHASRTAPTTFEVPALELGPAHRDRTTVNREHTEESFAETLTRCLRDGLVLALDQVGCVGD